MLPLAEFSAPSIMLFAPLMRIKVADPAPPKWLKLTALAEPILKLLPCKIPFWVNWLIFSCAPVRPNGVGLLSPVMLPFTIVKPVGNVFTGNSGSANDTLIEPAILTPSIKILKRIFAVCLRAFFKAFAAPFLPD